MTHESGHHTFTTLIGSFFLVVLEKRIRVIYDNFLATSWLLLCAVVCSSFNEFQRVTKRFLNRFALMSARIRRGS
jgi:hypothetical protein